MGENMKRSTNPEDFLTPEEKAQIENAIGAAEKKTNAEIKFVISRHCWGNIRDKAVSVFRKLGLYQTKERNCVLIMLVTTNREFAIYGDTGINSKVTQEYWDTEKDAMVKAFREDRFGDGVAAAVTAVGNKLAEFYPPTADDVNEISNEVAHVE